MRILELPSSNPKKVGAKKVHKNDPGQEAQQLNLFTTGKILKLHPVSPFEEALMLDERGDRHGAEELYHKAIKTGDQVSDAYCNLGIIEAQQEHTIEAINYFTLSLQYDPRHLEAHFNLGNMYKDAGNLELGILHYQIAIKVDPAYSGSYFNLGLAFASNHKYQKAIDVFQQYRKLCPVAQQKPVLDMIKKLQVMI